jgi:thiol-disulfide isomerase/thioredoxin
MRRVLAAASAAAGALLVLGGCATGHAAVDVNNGGDFRFVAGTPAGEVLPVGQRAGAPSFSGTLLDGAPFASTSLRGSVAVLNFWGSWCAPCRVETPEFSQVATEVAGRGVRFLGVDVKEDRQFAQAFVAGKQISYPSLSDPRGEVALAFRDFPANAIPSTIVLDRQGRVAAVYTAAVRPADLQKVLDLVTGEG